MRDYLPLIGRFGLMLVFIVNGLHKLLEFEDSVVLLESKGVFFPAFLMIITIFIELIGGFLVIIGYRTKPAAILMCSYLMVNTLIFHPVWSDPDSFVDFVKNIAIMGGLLALVYHGPGPKSFDSHDLWS